MGPISLSGSACAWGRGGPPSTFTNVVGSLGLSKHLGAHMAGCGWGPGVPNGLDHAGKSCTTKNRQTPKCQQATLRNTGCSKVILYLAFMNDLGKNTSFLYSHPIEVVKINHQKLMNWEVFWLGSNDLSKRLRN